MRTTLGRGLDGSNTSYSSISSAVSDKSESLSMENWWMGGRRSYLSGNTERRNRSTKIGAIFPYHANTANMKSETDRATQLASDVHLVVLVTL